jgi:hypothetical protein
MASIDAAILDLTERCCRRFQLLTGRTNVWLALQLTNLSIVVYFVWAGISLWSSDTWPRVGLIVFCGGLLYVLTQTVFKVPIESYESQAYRRVSKGLRNPRRVRDASLRMSFLTLLTILPLLFSTMVASPELRAYINERQHVILLTYALIVLTTIVLYLLACDPLPPCTGKVWEWLRAKAPARTLNEQSYNDLK